MVLLHAGHQRHCSGAPRRSRARPGRTRCRQEGPCGTLTGGEWRFSSSIARLRMRMRPPARLGTCIAAGGPVAPTALACHEEAAPEDTPPRS